MEDHTLQNILLNTFTKSDFYRCLGVVQEYLEHIFYNTDDADDSFDVGSVVLHAQNSGNIATAELIGKWGDSVLSTFTRDNLYDRVKELKEGIEKLPELVLYVPASLEAAEVLMIGSWCRENIDHSLLLDISVDPNAIGGCMFVWNGIYHDFSLNYFLEKKEDTIGTLLSEYDA